MAPVFTTLAALPFHVPVVVMRPLLVATRPRHVPLLEMVPELVPMLNAPPATPRTPELRIVPVLVAVPSAPFQVPALSSVPLLVPKVPVHDAPATFAIEPDEVTTLPFHVPLLVIVPEL